MNFTSVNMKLNFESFAFILRAIDQQAEIERKLIGDRMAEVDKVFLSRERPGKINTEKGDVIDEALKELLKNLAEELEKMESRYNQAREWLEFYNKHTCPAIRGG